jgi:hypothetical protein
MFIFVYMYIYIYIHICKHIYGSPHLNIVQCSVPKMKASACIWVLDFDPMVHIHVKPDRILYLRVYKGTKWHIYLRTQ